MDEQPVTCECKGVGTLGIDPETNERLWCDCRAGRTAHLDQLRHEIDRKELWLQSYARVYRGLAPLVKQNMERQMTEYDELRDRHIIARLSAELGI